MAEKVRNNAAVVMLCYVRYVRTNKLSHLLPLNGSISLKNLPTDSPPLPQIAARFDNKSVQKYSVRVKPLKTFPKLAVTDASRNKEK